MNSRARRPLGLLLAVSTVGACTFGGHGPQPRFGVSAAATQAEAPVTAYHYAIDNQAKAPAVPVPNAATGGTVRVYDGTDYSHLDPARIYQNNLQTVSLIITRTLTGYVENGTDIKLVGDLATDTGRTTDGGRTWTYTLRDGVTWEDGSSITSADVKYGLEREFVPDYSEGPTYVQSWIAGTQDFHSVYQGPYDGKSLDAISTPDPKTVVISFKQPQPDLPFAMALQGAPVKASKDTRGRYDQRPFASGPYRIDSHEIDKSMTLVRNTAWKPESDPIRTAYPDRFEFTFGEVALDTNRRLISAAGDDAAALTVSDSVSPEVLDQVLNDPELKARSVSGLSQFADYVVINTRRIKDLNVRKALMYAYPRFQLRQLVGGPDVGDFASTLSSPTLIGHQQYDLFDVPPEGDPVKARELLKAAGRIGMKIVIPFGASSRRGQQATIIEAQALAKAGFQVVKKYIDPKAGGDITSDPNNQFDLYGYGWAADWPSGSTVFPPLFDGRLVANSPGNTDNSFFDDPAIDKEMDAIKAVADPVEAGKRWSALERRILAQVPIFPDLYQRVRQIYGPRIGGAALDNLYGEISLNRIFVKP